MASVKVAGSWKSISSASHKVGGAWKPVPRGYTKVSGVWRSILDTDVPENVIILYQTDSDVPLDATVDTSLNNLFPRGTDVLLGNFGGSDSHGGSDHGEATTTYSVIAHRFADGKTGAAITHYTTDTEHTHTFTHTHTSVSGIVPSTVYFIPTYGAKAIGPNAVILTEGSVSETFLLLVTDYLNRYLAFRSSQASVTIGGTTTHAHGKATGDTTTYDYVNQLSETLTRNQQNLKSHYHPAESNMDSVNNLPSYRSVQMQRVTSGIKWGDLPSGSILFIRPGANQDIPEGWEYALEWDGRLPRLTDGLSTIGGSDTHTHGSTDPGLGNGVAVQSDNNAVVDDGSGPYRIGPLMTHTHTATAGIHTGSGNSLPPYVNVLPIRKL